MTHFESYLLTRLDSIIELSCNMITLILIFVILVGVGFLFAIMEESKDKYVAFIKKFIKPSIFILILALTIKTLTPTSKEMAFIYIAPAVVNNEDLQKTVKQLPELSSLGLEYLNGLLKEEINNNK